MASTKKQRREPPGRGRPRRHVSGTARGWALLKEVWATERLAIVAVLLLLLVVTFVVLHVCGVIHPHRHHSHPSAGTTALGVVESVAAGRPATLVTMPAMVGTRADAFR